MSTFGDWACDRLRPSDNPCIVVRCNRAIKLESVHYALVAYGIKYIRLLVTTLSFVIHCNTVIRPESVRYALVTHG